MTPDHQESFQEYFQFFSPAIEETKPATRKLYLIPTTHGENFDPDFAPNPSPLSELPNIERWTLTYTICAIEILAVADLLHNLHVPLTDTPITKSHQKSDQYVKCQRLERFIGTNLLTASLK